MVKRFYPYEKNGRFYFDESHRPESLFLGTLPSFVRSLLHRRKIITSADVLASWIMKDIAPPFKSINPLVTWIGHATFLLQVNGVNILTDPIFGSPSILCPRVLRPGILFDQLPPIDGVLISHNHRDHMDEATIMALHTRHPNCTFFVPFGDRRWFLKRGITRVHEFIWEQTGMMPHRDENLGVMCTFMPAHHWSARGLFDKNRSLWGGWVIQVNSSIIYFAGDTAYHPDCFLRVKELFPIIDLAIMPISPQEPHDWMRHTHMNAQQAGEAFLLTNATRFMPMHWGTYLFGYDSFDSPMRSLVAWWEQNEYRLSHKELQIVKAGQPYVIPGRLIEPHRYTNEQIYSL